MEPMLTPDQVAERLQVHWQTVLSWIRRGLLPAVRLEKGYRISQADLQTFLAARATVQREGTAVVLKSHFRRIK